MVCGKQRTLRACCDVDVVRAVTCCDVDLIRAVTLISHTEPVHKALTAFAVAWPVAVAHVSPVSAAALTTRPRCFHHRSIRCTAGFNSLACSWRLLTEQAKRLYGMAALIPERKWQDIHAINEFVVHEKR